MKRSDVSEEVRYCWECPQCGDWNEECEDPNYEDFYVCDSCSCAEDLED